jgi:tetratricopeptide (TPR) repeat protein
MATDACAQASEHYAAARQALPSSPKIERALEESLRAIVARRQREALLQSRLTVAEDAAKRADWYTLLVIVKEIHDLDPGNAAAEQLRLQATKNLAAVPAAQRRTPATPVSSAPITADPMSMPSPLDSGIKPNGDTEHTDSRTPRVVRAAELLEEARRHFESGDLVAAERLAAQSVASHSESSDARYLLERVRAAIIVQGKKDETWRRVTDRLRQANALADQKQYVKAIVMVDEALAINAGHSAAAAMRGRLNDEHAAFETERAAEAARQRRERAAAPALAEARHAFQQSDLIRARYFAESALALAPQFQEARTLLGQIVSAIPAPTDDDTVVIDDPQDTVEFAPVRRSVKDRITELRLKGSAWVRRIGYGTPKDR